MNMLRLFESATIRKVISYKDTQFPLLQSNKETVQHKKGDKKKFVFLKFFLLGLMIGCSAPPPVVHSSGITLLNSLVKQESIVSSQSVAQNTSSSSNSAVSTDTTSTISETETGVSPSDFYVVYPRSEFIFFVGDWIEIQPAETKNILDAQVLGKLPDGLEFDELSMTLFGSLEAPLKKTQIKIKARATNKSNYITKFYLTVEEKGKPTLK